MADLPKSLEDSEVYARRAAAKHAAEVDKAAKALAKAAPAPEKPTDVAGAAAAAGESFARRAIDAAMAPVTLGAAAVEALAPEGSELAQGASIVRGAASGGAMLGSLAGIKAGEFGTGPGEAKEAYEAEARRRADEHPIAAGIGGLAGDVAGIVGTGGLSGLAGGARAGAQRLVGPGLAARLAGATAQGVVEGAALGAGAAQSEAWIAQRRLTGQQVLATAGLSGLLGGALSFSAEGMGALIGAGRARLAGQAASKAEGAAAAAGESVAEKSLGQQVADRAKPLIETATRSDDAAVRQAGKAALGEDMGERMPEFYRDIVRGRDVRPRIVSEASGRLTEDASTVMRSSSELADEMVSRASKLEHVEANFARTPPPGPVATTDPQLARILSGDIPRLKPTRGESLARQSEFFRGANTPEQATRIATSEEWYSQGGMPNRINIYEDGGAIWSDGNHRVSAARSAGATDVRADVYRILENGDEQLIRKGAIVPIDGERALGPSVMDKARGAAESLLQEVQSIESAVSAQMRGGKVTELQHLSGEMSLGLKAVAEAKTPAQAYMAIDHMRRQLLRSHESLSSAARGGNDALAIRVNGEAAEALKGTYQKAADHLFDTSVWGAQGAAQKEVNDAWVRFIEAKKYAFGDFARHTGDTLTPAGKMPTFTIQEGKVAGIVDRFGTPSGRDSLRAFEQYVSAAERLSNAIGKGYELGGTKSKALAELQKSVASIRGTLDSVAKDTASLSQAEALFKGGEHSLIGGVLGRVADLTGVSGPAASMRARVTLEVNANRAAKQIQQAIDYVFQPTAKAAAKEAAREVPGFVQRAAGATSAAARRVPARMSASSAMAHFIGRHGTAEVAYERRKDEILAANANNGEAIRNAVADSLGALGRQDPHAMASMVVSATKGAQYLQSKLPQAPATPSFTPMTNSRRPPSRAEIAQFAELYEAVDRPLQTLSKLGLGTVSRDQVRAIADVYPELYEHIKTEVLARIRKQDELGQEIPYRQRVVLDTVLDLAGQADRTLQPDFALKYGPAIRATAPQPSDAAPKPPTKSTIPNRYSTGTTTMLGGQS